MDLRAHVADFFSRHRLGASAGVVAVSGGPDSVALAHLLYSLAPARLILAHVNHQLRGDESDADEAFVHSLPERWAAAPLRVLSRRIPVAVLAGAERDNLESVARRERFRFLTEIARAEGAAWIATGHTADDQAETVLFRLMRGSGVLGLSAMADCRPVDGSTALLVRPLLEVRRHSVLQHLNDHAIPYRIDSSNRDLAFTRNRIRLELLPMLEANYNPEIVTVLCRCAEQARDLHADVTAEAARLLHAAELPRAGGVLVFALERLSGQPANALREMFRLVWQRENWPMGAMTFEHWQRLVELVQEAVTAADFPGRIRGKRVGKVLQLLALSEQPS